MPINPPPLNILAGLSMAFSTGRGKAQGNRVSLYTPENQIFVCQTVSFLWCMEWCSQNILGPVLASVKKRKRGKKPIRLKCILLQVYAFSYPSCNSSQGRLKHSWRKKENEELKSQSVRYSLHTFTPCIWPSGDNVGWFHIRRSECTNSSTELCW